MDAVESALWPHQHYALEEVPRLIRAGRRKVCLTSPTGGGKTRIICGLVRRAVSVGWPAVVYTNRRLLVDQLARVLGAAGIPFAVRAAGHAYRPDVPVQVSSLPTENARVFRSEEWALHGEGRRVLALVDEAHLNAGAVACRVLAAHHADGGAYVGLTATPVGLAHLYDDLVIAGTPSDLRACGALVPAYHYGPDEPDMRGFKQSLKTGEYTESDVRKAVMTKCIIARVLDNYRRLNFDGRPTILFAPGVPESIWFAEQLSAAGIAAAHVDGSGYWLGGRYHRTGDRSPALDAFRCGTVKVLCNRFVLREGLDMPAVSHLILATVFGSLRTYLQSAGRGLRACPGKDRLTLQDHGGHWHRHGSINADRAWRLTDAENVLQGLRQDAFREKKTAEPISCVRCGMVRSSGMVCPGCGHTSPVRSRVVVQLDGSLVRHEGDIYKPRRVAMKRDTARVWSRCYHRARQSRNRMTFRQAEALFYHENYYYPPRTLPLMPSDPLDWFVSVADVPPQRLIPAKESVR